MLKVSKYIEVDIMREKKLTLTQKKLLDMIAEYAKAGATPQATAVIELMMVATMIGMRRMMGSPRFR